MTNTSTKSLNSHSATFDLLTYYSLEPDRYPQPLTKVKVLGQWLRTYPEQWVRWALIESLYQGRYKTFSVEQLLALWHRRGQPLYHFNSEFEAMVCHNVPRQMQQKLPLTSLKHSPQPLETQGQSLEQSLPLGSESTKSEPLASPLHLEENASEVQAADSTAEFYWDSPFEPPRTDTRESVLASVLNNAQLLPLTLGRLGLEPIHQFMPEAEPAEFCEKLAAIARHQRP